MDMKKKNSGFTFTGNENSLLWRIGEWLCTQPTMPLLDMMIQNPEFRQVYEEAADDSKAAVNALYEEIVRNCSENVSREKWNILVVDTVNTIEREMFFRGLLLGIRFQKEYDSL